MENEINWEIVNFGETAKRLKDSDDYKEVIERINADIFKQFRRTHIASVSDRENIHALAHAVDALELYMQKYVDAAKLEKAKAEPDEDNE